MEVGEGLEEDRHHPARQGSGKVFAGCPGQVRLFSSSRGNKAGSALLED